MRHLLRIHTSKPVLLLLFALITALVLPGTPAAAQEGGETATPEEEASPRVPIIESANVVEGPLVIERGTTDEPADQDADADPTSDTDTDTVNAPRPAPPPAVDAPPRSAMARPGHRAVRDVERVMAGGGRVDAARQGDWIAFDMVGPDGRYDVYLLRLSQGEGNHVCFTCDLIPSSFHEPNTFLNDKPSFINPAWHPSGDYLVIAVQSSSKRRNMNALKLATPHRGLGGELWVFTRDGKDFYQITQVTDNGRLAIDPHFSHEADALVWSERFTNRRGPWGEWVLRVTEFRIGRGVPRLGKSRIYRPGLAQGHYRGLALAHAFTPDDGGLYVSAIPAASLPERRDLLRIDLETEKVERLTSTPDEDDGFALAVPSSDFLVWTTDRNLGARTASRQLPARSEVWLRSTSGTTQERLTFFNDPASDHYVGEALVDDLSWTAEGDGLLVHVLHVSDDEVAALEETIFLIRFGPELRR